MASKTQLKTREKGSGTIYKDGKRFYLKIRIAGKTKTKMLRNEDGTACTNADDAEKAASNLQPLLLAKSKEEIAFHVAQAKRLRKISGLTLSVAWEAYLKQSERPDSGPRTLDIYSGIFKRFRSWLKKEHPGIIRVGEIDDDIAKEYFNDLWESGVSGRTYNAHRQALRLIFKHLTAPAGLDSNPFDCIQSKPVETTSRQEFTSEQVKQIFEGFQNGFFYETTIEVLGPNRKRTRKKVVKQFSPTMQDEMEVLLNLLCWTACREQDGCAMEWSCIDFVANRITYTPKKTARKTNDRKFTLPLHPDLKTALQKALEWRSRNVTGEDYILPQVAKRFKRNPTGVQGDIKKIIHCATGLKITDKNPKKRRKLAANIYSGYSFRHSFVSFCANAGVPLDVVASLVGHGNPVMTRHYTHINDKSKREAIAALPRISDSPKSESLLERLNQAVAEASEEKLKEILKQLEK